MKISRRDTAKLLVGSATATAMSTTALARSDHAILGISIEWQQRPLGLDVLRPRIRWKLRASPRIRGFGQSAFRLSIADEDGLAILDTGRISSNEMAFRPSSNLPLKSQASYKLSLEVWDQTGRSLGDALQVFATGMVAPGDNHSQWLAIGEDITARHALEGRWHKIDNPIPLPLFRRTLRIKKSVRQAHLCIAGLGQYQLWIDNHKVSPDGLNGGWTNYDKRVIYDAYDLTDRLKIGQHLLGVALGNGFFNVETVNGRYSKFDGTFGRPQLWAQLRLLYRDGSEELISSDSMWEVREGGTTYSSIYGGEDFDGRCDDRNFGTGDWSPATLIKGPAGVLACSTFRPMIVRSRLQPKTTLKQAGGIVYDFGRNHSGRPQIRLKDVPAGTVIRMIPAELLADNGLPDQQSMVGGTERGYRGIAFNYTARGGIETWSPQFTYTGYRYLQVEGVELANIEAIESLFLSDDVAPVGTFNCSDARMELVHGLIHQALVSNSASVLTDCPQREKLGWLEQIYLNGHTALMNSDMVRVYEKMMADIRDAQEPDGKVPTIAPEFTKFVDNDGKDTRFRDSPEWGAALILGAWAVYRLYGDHGILEQNYDAMKRRITFMETRRSRDGLIDYGLGDWFDIGPNKPGSAQLTSRKMTGTATYYAELVTLANIARIIHASDENNFRSSAAGIKQALLDSLFNPERSTFDTGSQTSQAMGLTLGLFPDDHRAQALTRLIDDIRSRQNQVTAGDIGFHYVVRALTDGGRSDILYDMLSRQDGPSYLSQLRTGATSLTEAWDGGRQSSQNHFMLGHAEIWFYQGLGGLDIDLSRAENQITLAPQLVEGIVDQAASYEAVFGRCYCRLRRKDNHFIFRVDVPTGKTARIMLPRAQLSDAREGYISLKHAEGISDIITSPTGITVSAISGSYEFRWEA